jgi:hypothetical protein
MISSPLCPNFLPIKTIPSLVANLTQYYEIKSGPIIGGQDTRSSDRGVWWRILLKLQSNKKITLNIVLADSTTFKVHRHGGGLKGGSKAKV